MPERFTGCEQFNVSSLRKAFHCRSIGGFYEKFTQLAFTPSNLYDAESGGRNFTQDIQNGVCSEEGYGNILEILPRNSSLASQLFDNSYNGFLNCWESCPEEYSIIFQDTVDKLKYVRDQSEQVSTFVEKRPYYCIGLQLILTFFVTHNPKTNSAWGFDHYCGHIKLTPSPPPSQYKILPVLNRLASVRQLNLRNGESYPVPITRACLFALLYFNLEHSGQDLQLLQESSFSSTGLIAFKDACRHQRGADGREWTALADVLEIQLDRSGKNANIGIKNNKTDEADDLKTLDTLYQTLKRLKASPAGSRYLIDQYLITLTKYLNAISAKGYFKHSDPLIEKNRKESLLKHIELLQECSSSSPDYMFSILEADENGENRIALEADIVHNLVEKYYQSSYIRSDIGKQYLEWCRRNRTRYRKSLVTQLICFDFSIWSRYARMDPKTLLTIMNEEIFSKFCNVDLETGRFKQKGVMERAALPIETVKKMFNLALSTESEASGFLYKLFFTEYPENTAKMIVYILYNPTLFCGENRRENHLFIRFVSYIIGKTSETTTLYSSKAFENFHAWDSLDSAQRHAQTLLYIKTTHYRLYHDHFGSDPYVGFQSHNTTSCHSNSLSQAIFDFQQGRRFSSVREKNESRVRLLKRICLNSNDSSQEEQDAYLSFAKDSLRINHPDTIRFGLQVLEKKQDTSGDRIQIIDDFLNRRRVLSDLPIYWISACLSHQLITEHFSGNIIEGSWQHYLLKILLTKDNRSEYRNKRNYLVQFAVVEKLLHQLLTIFNTLPLEMQIGYVYFVRNETEIINRIDFSSLSLAEYDCMDTGYCFDLWRFYCEIKPARAIQLGNHGIEKICAYLVNAYFQAILTSTFEVRSRFRQGWNNVLYHLLQNSPAKKTAMIAAFVAYKISGEIYHSTDEDAIIGRFRTQIKQLSSSILGHPCCYNLMTEIMESIRRRLILSPVRTQYESILSYISENLHADERLWLGETVKSDKSDRFAERVVLASSIYILQDRALDRELSPDLYAYLNRGDYSVPFEPAQPIVVVEADGKLYAVENRRLLRLLNHCSVYYGYKDLSVKVTQWIPIS